MGLNHSIKITGKVSFNVDGITASASAFPRTWLWFYPMSLCSRTISHRLSPGKIIKNLYGNHTRGGRLPKLPKIGIIDDFTTPGIMQMGQKWLTAKSPPPVKKMAKKIHATNENEGACHCRLVAWWYWYLTTIAQRWKTPVGIYRKWQVLMRFWWDTHTKCSWC